MQLKRLLFLFWLRWVNKAIPYLFSTIFIEMGLFYLWRGWFRFKSVELYILYYYTQQSLCDHCIFTLFKQTRFFEAQFFRTKNRIGFTNNLWTDESKKKTGNDSMVNSIKNHFGKILFFVIWTFFWYLFHHLPCLAFFCVVN